MYPPTEPQLSFLKKLRYTGQPPLTKAEASFLIDGRKSKKTSEKLEKRMLATRAKNDKKWFKDERACARMEIDQAAESAGAIAGFRIKIGKRCADAKKYNGAFLPTRAASRHPTLLPPYADICRQVECECEYEEVLENERLSPKMPMITAPNKIITVRRWNPRTGRERGSSFVGLMLLVIVGVILALFVAALASV